MSYDIFCYKPSLDIPDEEDAESAIAKDENKFDQSNTNPEQKMSILQALIKRDPTLVAEDYRFGPIASLSADILRSNPKKFHHIKVNTAENDEMVRLDIYNNHVHINFNYTYHKEQAAAIINKAINYVKVIRDAAGYFVSDPQLGKVFDPAINYPDILEKFLDTAKLLPGYVEQNETPIDNRKPWWKFWK